MASVAWGSNDKSIRFNGGMLFKDKYKLVMYL